MATKSYNDRKRRGICVQCGSCPPMTGLMCLLCREKSREYSKKHYYGYIDEQKTKRRNRYSRNWKRERAKRFEAYGIEERHALALLELQEYCCAACWEPLGIKEFHIDHDHNQNFVRGILHSKCNRALGQAEDDPELLRKLASYLETSNNVMNFF